MDVKIKRGPPLSTFIHGGGYALQSATIAVDTTLPPKVQCGVVIHEVLELYFPSLSHEVIEELTETLQDALDKLEELK